MNKNELIRNLSPMGVKLKHYSIFVGIVFSIMMIDRVYNYVYNHDWKSYAGCTDGETIHNILSDMKNCTHLFPIILRLCYSVFLIIGCWKHITAFVFAAIMPFLGEAITYMYITCGVILRITGHSLPYRLVIIMEDEPTPWKSGSNGAYLMSCIFHLLVSFYIILLLLKTSFYILTLKDQQDFQRKIAEQDSETTDEIEEVVTKKLYDHAPELDDKKPLENMEDLKMKYFLDPSAAQESNEMMYNTQEHLALINNDANRKRKGKKIFTLA